MEYKETINKIQEELDDNFMGRKKDLLNVPRYHIYKTMMYRTNLYNHSKRLAWEVAELAPFIKKAFPNFNFTRAFIIALIHDDPEMITGDIQAVNKAKMNEEELKEVDSNEKVAIKKLSSKYPKELYGFSYEEISLDVLKVSTPEAAIVKYLDKIDGFSETLHELYAGNEVFTIALETEFGKVKIPYDYYMEKIPNFHKEFPIIEKLLNVEGFPIKELTKIDQFKIVKVGRAHKLKSIKKKKGHNLYDLWIAINLKYGSSEEIKELYEKQEWASPEGRDSKKALKWIMNIIEKNNIEYQIVGGLAAKTYGSTRNLADIDLYVNGKDFVKISNLVKEYITWGPDLWISHEWRNEITEVKYEQQKIEIVNSDNCKFFHPEEKKWIDGYIDYNNYETKTIFDTNIKVIPKKELIEYKKKLKRNIDIIDINQIL